MSTGGASEDDPCPCSWYPTLVAAEELRVEPWVLVRKSLVWQSWALMKRNAEAKAHEALSKAKGT